MTRDASWKSPTSDPMLDILEWAAANEEPAPMTFLISPKVARAILTHPNVIAQYGKDVTLVMINEDMHPAVRFIMYEEQ